MVSESIGARIKSFREAKGLSRYRLAKLSLRDDGTHICQTYLGRIEHEEIRNPRRDTLQAIAQGLNIAVAQLIGETGPLDSWQLVEQSLKAYIPVYSGIYEEGMIPVDHVVCTRSKVPSDTLRGYRIEGLSLEPEIRDGDTIIVDSAAMPQSGDLVVMVSKQGKAKTRNVAIKRYVDGTGSTQVEDNECACELDAKGCCKVHNLCVHGVICEYVRKLRQM